MFKLLSTTKIQILTIVVLTSLAYSNIFFNQTVIDDRAFISKAYLDNLNPISALTGFVPAGHEGVYRPTRSFLYWGYYQIFGLNLVGWHLQALLVHLLCTILVYLIASRLWLIANRKTEKINDLRSATSYLPFLTALLFGLHPIHTESITYIAASMEMTGVVFFLASFYFYIRSRHPELEDVGASFAYSGSRNRFRIKSGMTWSVVFALLAFFTYEMTLTLPLTIILYEVTLGVSSVKGQESRKQSFFSRLWTLATRLFAKTWPYLTLATGYGLVRVFLIHAGTRGPYLADSFYLTMLTMTKVLVRYIKLLIWPLGQANNHTISQGIEAFVYRGYRTEAISAQTLFSPGVIIPSLIIILVLAVAIYCWRKIPLVTFATLWFFIAILPGAEIVPQGSMMNEKLMYIPSIGFCLLLAYLIQKLRVKIQKYNSKFKSLTFDFLLVLLTFTLCLLTFMRNLDWHDELKLWNKDITVYPTDNAYAYFQRGNAYLAKGDQEQGIKDYQNAFTINPHFAVAIASAAKVYDSQGKADLARKSYQRAVSADPNFWEGWFNLGNSDFNQGNLENAGSSYYQVTKINPGFQPAQTNLSVVIQKIMDRAEPFSTSLVYFKYPKYWKLTRQDQNIILTSQTGSFKVTINPIGRDEQSYGQIVNQGLAQIPNVDSAKVIVWSFEEAQDKQQLLQFFLTKGQRTVEILVTPADSYLMKVFDQIIGSLQIRD